MIIHSIIRETSRQISEYRQFQFNLFFANLSIFFMVNGLLSYFDGKKDPLVLFLLLFTWYFAVHGLTHPTYFIEDELTDRTMVNVLQSKQSIWGLLVVKIWVQFLLDCLKGLPLFALVAWLQAIAFPTAIWQSGLFFLLSFAIVFALYGLGTFFASFCFLFTKISSLTSFIADAILILLGLQELGNPSLHVLTRLFPFYLLENFIQQPRFLPVLLVLLYSLVYWTAALLSFKICLRYAKKKGSLFHV